MKKIFVLLAVMGAMTFSAQNVVAEENQGTPTEQVTQQDEPGSVDPKNSPDDPKPNFNESKNTNKSQQSQPQGSGWTMWIMLALIFGVMWFFMIRPQKKQQKELQKFRDSLKRGDKVVTIGGIYGTVVEIKEASVLIEVDNGVKIRVSKQALIKDFSDSQQ